MLWITAARRGAPAGCGGRASWLGRSVRAGLLSVALAGGGGAVAAETGSSERPSGWIARVWQASDGLTDNRVSGLAQTPDGYLWIGTFGRLVRFNGTSFAEHQLDAINGVKGKGPRAMFRDRRGRLWMSAVREQVLCVGPDTATVYVLPEAVRREPISALAEAADGTIWLAIGLQICRIREGQIVLPAGLPPATTSASLVSDGANQVWCALDGKIGRLRGEAFQPVLTVEAPARLAAARGQGVWLIAGHQIRQIDAQDRVRREAKLPEDIQPALVCEDAAGGLWLGTQDRGLFRYAGGQLEAVPTSHLHISCLLADQEGNVWAGTMGGGLNRLRPRTVQLVGPRPTPPYESVSSVAYDGAGDIWAVTGAGRLLRWDGRAWQPTPNLAAGLEPLTAVAFARDGGLWLGTSQAGLHSFPQRDLPAQAGHRAWLGATSVRVLLAARDGAMWCATDNPARVTRIQANEVQEMRLPPTTRVVRCLEQAPDGHIWAGTTDGRVLQAQGTDFVPDRTLDAVAPYSVRCLHFTPDGVLLIGYADQGLGWYAAGNYVRFTTDDGLSDGSIHQIAADPLGHLWVASSKGVMQIPLAALRRKAAGAPGKIPCRLVGRDEGLPSAQAHYEHAPASCVTPDQRLYFASGIGVVELNPARLPTDAVPPPITIEQVARDEQIVACYGSKSPLRPGGERDWVELAATRTLTIPPEHRRLEFQFAALSYADAENVRFRYRLEGFDKVWLDARSERSAQYSKLPPGTYTLRVIAANGAGLWNQQGATLGLIVEPFFWQTWWFWALALLGFTGAIVAAVRIVSFQRLREKLRQAEQRAAVLQERTRIARDIHDDLGGSLTHIKLLSELARQDTTGPAEAQLRQITQAARQALKFLDETIWAINPRHDRLPDLISYVGQYVVDFLHSANVPCDLELPDNPDDLPIRSELRHHVFLVVKEALTNIVKHAAAQKVSVRISIQERELTLIIQDDGRGFTPAASSAGADGVRNMRQRMAALGGRLEVTSAPGGGTTIHLRVDLA